MPPAARITDMHVCPMVTGIVPHVGGPIITGMPTVITGKMPQARVMDKAICVGPPDMIIRGSATVLVGGLMAARIGDNTVHGGVIVTGWPTVIIGDGGPGSSSSSSWSLSRGNEARRLQDGTPGGRPDGPGGGAPAPAPGTPPKHYSQEKDFSCVVASTRNMIKSKTGKDVSEADLRKQIADAAGDPNHDFNKSGVNPKAASDVLKNNGVDNETKAKQSPEDLDNLTKGGKPVLIGFKNPGHRVMLDGVNTDKDGNKTYLVRDPDPKYNGERREMSQADFDKKYNQDAIVIVPK